MEQETPEITIKSKVSDLSDIFSYLEIVEKELNLVDSRNYRRTITLLKIAINRMERRMILLFITIMGILLFFLHQPLLWIGVVLGVIMWLAAVGNNLTYIRTMPYLDN
jgi:type IV secretory pathway TrbD component